MQKRRLWLGAGAAVVILAALFFMNRAPKVDVTHPTRGPAVEAVYATGTVEPVSHAEVGSKVTGRIVEVRVKEGQRVAAGDVLAVIDEGEEQSNLADLKSRLILAENDLARNARLRKLGHISQAALDQAVSARNSTRALMEAVQARLEDHFIKSPLDGEVMRSPDQIKPGDMAQLGKTLFIVGDPSRLRIESEVDEEDIPRVKTGQEALLRADAFVGQPLKGTVSEMTPFGDPVKRTYRVYIDLPPDTPLLAGMTTEINIIINRRNDALLVPATSVAGDRVWIVEDGKAKMQKADIGTIGKDKAEIRSGLAPDADVIVNPTGLTDGASVRAHEIEAK